MIRFGRRVGAVAAAVGWSSRTRPRWLRHRRRPGKPAVHARLRDPCSGSRGARRRRADGGRGLVDRNNRPLAPYDSWLDTRCAEVAADLQQRLGNRIAATAGCAPTTSIGPKMVWWQRHRPRTCADATSFVTAAGYVAATAAGLGGDQAFIDPTYLHFTSVADVATDQWDADLVTAVELDGRLLPHIVASTDIIGHLTSDAAELFGLPSGLPVAAGCGRHGGQRSRSRRARCRRGLRHRRHCRRLRYLPRVLCARSDNHPDDHASRPPRKVVRPRPISPAPASSSTGCAVNCSARRPKATPTTGSPPLPARPPPVVAVSSCPHMSAVV